MWDKSDREWRAALWRHMLDMLPVEVLVNLAGQGFSMRERWNNTIYADDINEAQYARMIDEWAALLNCGEWLKRGLKISALNRRFTAGKRAFYFKLATKIGPLNVHVRFRGKPRMEPFIIRMEREESEEATERV